MKSEFCVFLKTWISSRDFWKRYRQMDLLRPTVFFRSKTISKVAIIKARSVTLAFFPLLLSFRSLFLFLLSFAFVAMILELLGLKKHAFWRLSTQMTKNFVRLVFKKSARYTFRFTKQCVFKSLIWSSDQKLNGKQISTIIYNTVKMK